MNPGIIAALGAAALFGISMPLAKLLLGHAAPAMLAALMYLGSGIGLWGLRRLRRQRTSLPSLRGERRWLAGAILCGGIMAPVLLMSGLAAMPASDAALLLNAEGVLTTLLAWFVFREAFDRRIALGMLAIAAGAMTLNWPAGGVMEFARFWPAAAVLGACLGWAIDNNLTRKVALVDAAWIAMVKGLAAGITNLFMAHMLGETGPRAGVVLSAMVLGFLGYGLSLSLFVVALRHLGTARTGAYFSVAPFIGAVLAVLLLDDPVTLALLVGGGLMAVGVALHLAERHTHLHRHEPIAHAHEHIHGVGDLHHQHAHVPPVLPGTRHSHWHRHAPLEHVHTHYPDAHHTHSH
ncbi:MAG TPA: DMT family transporter [Candidatus Acidoferrales bacterium]|nr:DMT family transporter [Candidatus Acidoferrales bacterium]